MPWDHLSIKVRAVAQALHTYRARSALQRAFCSLFYLLWVRWVLLDFADTSPTLFEVSLSERVFKHLVCLKSNTPSLAFPNKTRPVFTRAEKVSTDYPLTVLNLTYSVILRATEGEVARPSLKSFDVFLVPRRKYYLTGRLGVVSSSFPGKVWKAEKKHCYSFNHLKPYVLKYQQVIGRLQSSLIVDK